MHEYKFIFSILLLMGGLIAIARILGSNEKITPKQLASKIIMGSIVTVVSGGVLVHFPDINPLAILGIGAAMGIIGYPSVESWLRRKISSSSQRGKDK